MKVILRSDVENLGDKGTVQNVSDGYARNYLIPKGFAILATPGELKVVAENQKVKDRKILRQEKELQSLADRITGQSIEFEARAGSNGRLFGSVTAAEIAERLSEMVGVEIDRRKVVLDDPIRALGSHTVTIHLVGRLRPTIVVVVKATADSETEESEVAASNEADETVDAVENLESAESIPADSADSAIG